jgi:O-antigen/teichoic acid export membrane protein
LPLTILAVAGSDVALAACAWRYDIAASVRARAIIEPWTISIGALVFSFYSLRDGLILSYVVSMLAAGVAAFWPLARHFDWAPGWFPKPRRIWAMARRNAPLAMADAVELGSRRLDLFILGFFVTPSVVGIYYAAQQFASLPQKLKTSFEPILGPVITRNLQNDNFPAIARQVSQVGFWIVAAQAGIALSLGIPGEAVMGLVGPHFVAGTAALAFLLLAEVCAAPAVVSESALVYMARHLNMLISVGMIALQAVLSLLLILATRGAGYPDGVVAAAPALALALALAVSSLVKSLVLSRRLRQRIVIWRPALLVAASVAVVVGAGFVALPHRMEWMELVFGVPVTLAAYAAVIWRYGFGPDDRALFKRAPVG